MNKHKHLGSVVSQTMRERGIWTVFSSGASLLLPYLVDEESGELYMEAFPNEDEEPKNVVVTVLPPYKVTHE